MSIYCKQATLIPKAFSKHYLDLVANYCVEFDIDFMDFFSGGRVPSCGPVVVLKQNVVSKQQ